MESMVASVGSLDSQSLLSKPLQTPPLCQYSVRRQLYRDSTVCCCSQAKKPLIGTIYDSLIRKGHILMDENNEEQEEVCGTEGEIFLPSPSQLPRQRVGHTLEGIGWRIPDDNRDQSNSNDDEDFTNQPSLAEMTISQEELKRLITLGIRATQTMKLGKAGITQGFVDGIHQRWSNTEVVKIKCVDDFNRSNMMRVHRLLETKTRGVVVWRSGSSVILFRGKAYQPPHAKAVRNQKATRDNYKGSSHHEVKSQYDPELDSMLDGLGPRFTDWWGSDPLPIDADLLSPVAGYKKPPRLLPEGLKPKLTDDEVTYLRRLAKSLPPHFALGNKKNLQGLASSMLRLWERCEIAKIALKKQLQNHDVENVIEELMLLTGGTLLSRDINFVIYYRGKDFLPYSIASVLAERKALVWEMEKEKMSSRMNSLSLQSTMEQEASRVLEVEPRHAEASEEVNNDILVNGCEDRVTKALEDRQAESGHDMMENKKGLSSTELSKEDERGVDKDHLTEEESFMLRKLGLRMRPFLLLGRRGAFDGIVENMHLHWKHRDLVKIICKDENTEQAMEVARILERESGGILVGVERISKGHAIIIYRGRTYRRPSELRPKTLLNKKAALRQSIEAQRKETLNNHILRLKRTVERMKNYHGEAEKSTSSIKELDSKVLSEDKTTSLHLTEEDEKAIVSCDSSTYDRRSIDSISNLPSVEHASDGKTSNTEHLNTEKTIRPRISYTVYRRVPLSNKERLILRRQALKLKRPVQFHMGKKNVVPGLIESIRSYLERHPLVIVSVKGRAEGTSVADIISEIEKATGAILVSREESKVVFYRGWLDDGESFSRNRKAKSEAVSSELLKAIQNECEFG